ncbi:hypothetical protein GM418_10845 [Maribellus comscasis]|uniref:Uncharacterized protein n=1 Tax=Maribellus comscasis TaxID=2681766 RepID=A0A6I6JVN6_9BACT|nr:hypothetical protein [Maribellus comscasis]QGY44137.1 hypothetical protein GM418_10845 [Maribellus comscasis]
MRILAELPHARIVRYGNHKMKLITFNTLTVEMSGKDELSCIVSKEDLEQATSCSTGSIDLQYLISFKRNNLK